MFLSVYKSILTTMALCVFTKMGSYYVHYLQLVFSSHVSRTSLISVFCLWCGVQQPSLTPQWALSSFGSILLLLKDIHFMSFCHENLSTKHFVHVSLSLGDFNSCLDYQGEGIFIIYDFNRCFKFLKNHNYSHFRQVILIQLFFFFNYNHNFWSWATFHVQYALLCNSLFSTILVYQYH